MAKEEKQVRKVNKQDALVELGKGFSEAEELLKDEKKTEDFLEQLEAKLRLIPKLGKRLAMLPVLIALVRDYIQKKYTKIPLGTIIAIVSALIYFFAPVDLIPDAILGAGYVDDALVIAACLKLVSSDIEEYQMWKEENSKKNKEK